MKYLQNDGNIEENAVQNRFTAYLKVSLEHNKIHYVYKKNKQNNFEISYMDNDVLNKISRDDPFIDLFSSEIESFRLQNALARLREQERFILVTHVLFDISLKLIADELTLSYPTVKSLYRRSLEKLRKELLKDEF